MNAPKDFNEAMDLVRNLALQLKEREIKDAIASIEAKWAPLISGTQAVTPVDMPEPVIEPKLEPKSEVSVPVIQAAYDMMKAQGLIEPEEAPKPAPAPTKRVRLVPTETDPETLGFISIPASQYVRSNFVMTQESSSFLGRLLSRMAKARGYKIGTAKGAGGRAVNTYPPELYDELKRCMETEAFEPHILASLKRHMRRSHA